MEKPFELKALTDKLLARVKAQGVGIAEDVVDWTIESCAKHENAIVKGVGGVLVATKAAILVEVGKVVNK